MTSSLMQQLIFQALGGLGLFLLGLHFLSDGIRVLAASRMRSIMGRLAKTRIRALLTGTFVTGVVQSSSVVTVMIVGFVNSGIINLEQAIALIMGANIGTTVTSLFIALPIAKYGLPVLGAAALVFIFARRDKIRHAAMAILGLGMIFFGLELMTSGFRPIREMPALLSLFAFFDSGTLFGILKCIIFGAAVTVAIQSSSALIGIVMGMAASGVLAWQTSLAIVLGAEIGTTTTSLLAAATLSVNARRTSYAHLAFNVIGVTVAMLIFPLYKSWTAFIVGGDPGLQKITGDIISYPLAPIAIAAFVTSYNVLNTLMLIPWVPHGARLLNRLGSSRASEVEDLFMPQFLFEKAMEEPELAISLLKKEQDRYRKSLPGLLDGICRPDIANPRPLALLGQSLEALHREISGFGERLCTRDLAVDTAVRVIQHLQTQEMSDVLMQRLLGLSRLWDNPDLAGQARETAASWIEALDALVQETVEALLGPDLEQLQMLRTMTTVHGPNLEAIRRRYLESGERFSTKERRILLTVLGQIEGSLWILHRLCQNERDFKTVID